MDVEDSLTRKRILFVGATSILFGDDRSSIYVVSVLVFSKRGFDIGRDEQKTI